MSRILKRGVMVCRGQFPRLLVLLLVGLFLGQVGFAQNRVLDFRSPGTHLELSPAMLEGVDELTVEAWLQWERFNDYSPVLSFGERYRMLGLNNKGTEPTLQFFIYDESRELHRILVPDILRLQEWVHVAAVASFQGMKLYLNGVLVGTHAYRGGLSGMGPEPRLLLGQSFWDGNPGFEGRLDEVRFWRGERSREEIRADMHRKLSGREPGLLARYSFDLGPTENAGPTRLQDKNEGHVTIGTAQLPTAEQLPLPAHLHGRVLLQNGTPASGLMVHLGGAKDGGRTAKTSSGGLYHFTFFPSDSEHELSATWEDQGTWRLGLRPIPGESLEVPLALKTAVRLSGRVTGMDGEPLTEVLVQLVRNHESGHSPSTNVAATVFTDDTGRYRFVNTRPGLYWLRCVAARRWVYHGAPGRADDASPPPLENRLALGPERTLAPIDFKVATFRQGRWRKLNFMDGLPATSVLSMAQDEVGYLWLGTEYSGLVRYDGKEMLQLTVEDGLPDNKVNAIYPEDHDVLWLATTRGIARYAAGGFQIYDEEDGLPDNYVECILPDGDGGLWLGTRGGLCRFKQGEIRTFTTKDGLAGDQVRTLYRDQQGSLWIGTTGGVSQKKGDRFLNLTTGDGLPDNDVWAIAQTADGVLWFGTSSHGIGLYDGNRVRTYDTRDGLVGNHVRHLSVGADGTVWIATRKGVSRYLQDHVENHRTEDGLVHGEVWTVFQARDGLVWVGARGGGAAQYDSASHFYITSQDGLAGNQTTSLSRAPGGPLWIGSMKGVSCFDGRQIKAFTTREGLVDNTIHAVCAFAERGVWVGTDNGISMIQDGVVLPADRFRSLYGRKVTGIALGTNGQAWFATYGHGLFHGQGESIERATRYVGTGGGFLTAVYHSPEGVLWTGSRHVGRHGKGEDRLFTAEDGLNSAEINDLAADANGRLWIGSRAGLLQMKGERFISMSMGEGLVPNLINSISKAANDHMWLGTEAGAFVFDGENWVVLDTRDGLPGHNVRATWPEPDGSIWLATERGLLQYRRETAAPTVRVVQVRSRETHTRLEALPAFELNSPVALDVSSIDFRTHPEKRSYRYQLVRANHGPDSQVDAAASLLPGGWGRATRRSTFHWVPSEPGWHLFAVQAIDRDLNYSEPALLWLQAFVPWYADPKIIVPSLLLVILLLGALAWSTRSALIRRRQIALAEARTTAQEAFSRRLIDQQEGERKRIAHELHDSIGHSLLIMKNRAAMGIQAPANPAHMSSQLEEISELASQAIADARDIAFNLRPQHLDSLGVDKAITAMARKVCRSANLDLEIDVDDLADLLPADAQTHLFRIVQEGLNNIIKHAEASRVRLEIKRQDRWLRMRLEDDGRGISDQEEGPGARGGFGTTSLTERVKILGGTMERGPRPGGGTHLVVTLPLP